MVNKKKYPAKMYKEVALATFVSAAAAAAVLSILLLIFRGDFTTTTPSLTTGLIGTVMIFIGGSLIGDALSRIGPRNLPQYKYGSILQSAGLGFTIFALIVK